MWLDDVFAGVSEDSLVPTLDWSRYQMKSHERGWAIASLGRLAVGVNSPTRPSLHMMPESWI